MKELSIKEKAKRYDDALERARKINSGEGVEALADWTICEVIFPELKESEDERVRESLLEYLHTLPNHYSHNGVCAPEWLAWLEKQNSNVDNANKEYWRGYREGKQEILDKYSELEKQGEQKPAWSEEGMNKPNGGIVMEDFNDGNGFYKVNLAYLNEEQVEQIEELVKRWGLQPKRDEDESIISDLLDYFDEDKCLKHEVNDIIKWLKTIKPQQKGWGENEIKMLDNLITYLDRRKDLLEEIKSTYIGWLKSLKERYIWKPSAGQMKALHDLNLTGNISYAGQGQILIELYNDLKKLTE